MSDLNRRGFLQVAGAVGIVPLLPAVSIPTAAASGGASVSKALWASLYANSGSASEFVGFAKNMGLSNTAIQGVSARSIGLRAALSVSTQKMTTASAKTVRSTLTADGTKMQARQKLERALDHYLFDEAEETQQIDEPETEELNLESPDANS